MGKLFFLFTPTGGVITLLTLLIYEYIYIAGRGPPCRNPPICWSDVLSGCGIQVYILAMYLAGNPWLFVNVIPNGKKMLPNKHTIYIFLDIQTPPEKVFGPQRHT